MIYIRKLAAKGLFLAPIANQTYRLYVYINKYTYQIVNAYLHISTIQTLDMTHTRV